MSVVVNLSALTLRQLIAGASEAVGIRAVGGAVDAVTDFLAERFSDHSQRLTRALALANDKAWKSLEIALAGESFWERCQVLVARGEDKAFGRQVRAFLDATPFAGLPSHGQEFRQACLRELRAARRANLLAAGGLEPRQLAGKVAAFARFSDPAGLLEAEWQTVGQLGEELRQAGYPNLGRLAGLRPAEGLPLLVIAARYFFRRAVEDDPKLAEGLTFARMEKLAQAQEQGFAALAAAMAQQGQRLEDLLAEVRDVVVQTHSAVLDLQSQMAGQSEQLQQVGQAVLKLLEQHQLQRRELHPADSLSIRNEGERQLVKQLVARYRELPEGDRSRLPALLNAVGKLEVVTGDFDAAQRDFEQAATLTKNNEGKAEAHFNAYQAALERRQWDAALTHFLQAVRLEPRRFATFPVGKYQPQRILGAGGFGVAFLCRDRDTQDSVVVKTLTVHDLSQSAEQIFEEARALRKLKHEAIISLEYCGYTDPASKSRPYLVMEYFDGPTLEKVVTDEGPLSLEDFLVLARKAAEALQAAHGKGLLHRDVKPANLLVRRREGDWEVRLIDFGLALKQSVLENAGTTTRGGRTITGHTIAGTIKYAAPEQMGELPGVRVGPPADIYAFAKTCCFALFGVTEPTYQHWQKVPRELAELLGQCLAHEPAQRLPSFTTLLQRLQPLTRLTQIVDALPATAPFSAEAPRRGPLPARPPSDTEHTRPTAKDQPHTLLTASAVVFVCTTLVAILWNSLIIVAFLHSGGRQAEKGLIGEAAAKDRMTEIQILVISVTGDAASLVGLVGGLCMLGRRFYWVAMLGTITTALGSMFCVCLPVPVSVWAFIVLLRADTRNAFR